MIYNGSNFNNLVLVDLALPSGMLDEMIGGLMGLMLMVGNALGWGKKRRWGLLSVRISNNSIGGADSYVSSFFEVFSFCAKGVSVIPKALLDLLDI